MFNLAEFGLYDHRLRVHRLTVYGSYPEVETRYRRYAYVAEGYGILEVKVGNDFIPHSFVEGDLLAIEKGFEHKWNGHHVTLIIFTPDI